MESKKVFCLARFGFFPCGKIHEVLGGLLDPEMKNAPRWSTVANTLPASGSKNS